MRKHFLHVARLLVATVIAFSVVSTLSACGKKGDLEPPPEKDRVEKKALDASIPLPHA